MKGLALVGIALFVVAALYSGFSWFFGSRITASSQATWAAMETAQFDCPAGLEPRIDGWGKSGYSRICVVPKDGKWEAWEQGYKQISGSYRGGKQHGRWTYYTRDGSVAKVVEYRDGVEVPTSTVQ